ncbi:MAG: hypothetical protein GXO54_03130 [Chloroflexi bacterium]|nr:hypothetical protein [Chloroflexota bacterium]
MRVRDYHNDPGIRFWVPEPPQGYQPLGPEVREGGHRIAFWARVVDGHLEDVRFTASRRCRKLLALADVVAERLRGQPYRACSWDPAAVLATFADERDQGKLRARLDLIRRALRCTSAA